MSKRSFIKFDPETSQIECSDEWDISNIGKIKKELVQTISPKTKTLILNGKSITKMDSAGAWLITKGIARLFKQKVTIHLEGFSEQQKKLLDFSNKQQKSPEDILIEKKLNWLQQLGKYSLQQADEAYQFINFIGALAIESMRTLFHPKQWRLNTIFSVMNRAGTSALPIIALLSFMIGVVISYQMGNQLRNYGANIFIVNLVGYSILREFGPLLTAIMVAGRTGSAFTAQLGLMKINKEIDALNTMAMMPTELLLLPRVMSLFIVIPLLTIWADIFGIIGGMVMANSILDISWHEFLTRFQNEIPLRALLIGLGKAPVFALIIASISCFQGMEVRGTAENVGMRTTRGVVLSIFFIIIVDAIFSILLSHYKL